MSVFYSGWGYWEYDCMDSFDGETMRETIDKGSFIKVCNVFELPEDAEREIEFLGKTTVCYLLECIRSDGKGIRFAEYRTEPIGEPRFILCDERKGEQRFNIDNRPIIEKTVKFTKDDIIESQARDDTPKDLSETERNTMLKLILGMAIDAYKYDPGKTRNTATGNNNGSIKTGLEKLGLSLDEKTISKYLKEAAERFPEAKLLKPKS
jgi:hypothetical protein